MKKFIITVALVLSVFTLTACDGGRYEGLRLWAPGEPDHESICGIHDWKTNEVLLVDEIPEAIPETAALFGVVRRLTGIFRFLFTEFRGFRLIGLFRIGST